MTYQAHTPNDSGEWHGLAKHIREVTRLAGEFAAQFARAAGLLHDVGKYHPTFQKYLMDCYCEPKTKHRGPDHKAAGMLLARENRFNLLTLLIRGHHGGLPEFSLNDGWLNTEMQRDLSRLRDAITLAQQEIPELTALAPPTALPNSLREKLRSKTGQEFFLRMLFSALVDADYLDTERHFNECKAEARENDLTLTALLNRFDAQPPAPASLPVERWCRSRT